QNDRTEKYLSSYPNRNLIKNRLTELTNYPKYTVPTKEGDFYYYHKNDGLQNQSLLYRSRDLSGSNEEIVIDPHSFSENGTAAITNLSFNDEGTKLAYGISYNGSDWQEIRIKNLLTDEDYPEVLEWCKFTQIAWTKDDKGFYYNRYPSQDSFSFKDSSYYNKLYWHTLETSQEEDMVIYEDNEQKELSFSPTI